jgi:uncharacterized RDD family membrane protein YckC
VSTNSSPLITDANWKQEVNRRLAAHKSRRDGGIAPEEPKAVPSRATSRASEAAARVAARYAQAPSYSQMQAAEARTAVRAAEIATEVALEAQAHAEAKLAGLQAAIVPQPDAETGVYPFRERFGEGDWVPSLQTELLSAPPLPLQPTASALARNEFAAPVESVSLGQGNVLPPLQVSAIDANETTKQSFGLRWEPDLPTRSANQEADLSPHRGERVQDGIEISSKDWWEAAPGQLDSLELEPETIEAVEPELPIHANLIEFPRELVATRKVRPRLAETAAGAEALPGSQLSIFEVDPRAVSTQPEAAVAIKVSVGADWTGIQLDEQPQVDFDLEDEPVKAVPTIQLARMNRRVLAAVVDGTLIVGVFLGGLAMAASRVSELPAPREMQIGLAAGLLLTGLLYMAVFTLLAEATPGMKYASLSLCTFDDQVPSWLQRCARLCCLLISVLPLGLGLAWSLFDEDHMTWHDRLSKTYPRKS